MSQAPGDPNPLSLPPPTVCLPWAGFCFGIISSARLQLKKSSLCLSTPSLVFFFSLLPNSSGDKSSKVDAPSFCLKGFGDYPVATQAPAQPWDFRSLDNFRGWNPEFAYRIQEGVLEIAEQS